MNQLEYSPFPIFEANDMGTILEALESLVKKSRIQELYVDLACYTQEVNEEEAFNKDTIIERLKEINQLLTNTI